MLDRLLNYLFIVALVAAFTLSAAGGEHLRIVLGLLAALIIASAAFLSNRLSLDGAASAVVLGGFVFGLGGIPAAALVLVFFVTGTLITDSGPIETPGKPAVSVESPRRDGLQVWANGFWFAIFVFMGFLYDAPLFWTGAAGALATATADTWGTELGSKRFEAPTFLLKGWQRVPPGTEGGISVPGTLASIGGSLVISLTALIFFSLDVTAFFCIFLAGFLGSLSDSYLGATLQRQNYVIGTTRFSRFETVVFDNNIVNWTATGAGSLAAIILNLLLV